MTAVDVFVERGAESVPVGTLYSHRRGGRQSSTFSYTSGHLADPQAYSLDPALPLSAGAHQSPVGRALFGCFSDCAPDRWGRTLVARREASLARAESRTPRALGEIDYLLGVRDDLRQGALRFRIDDGPFLADGATGVPALTDLPSLLDLAARAERDTADLPDLQRLVHVGSSLGGARPKAHVEDVDGRLAIAKFPSTNDDSRDVTAWEKVALDCAGLAGIDVPSSQLLRLADRSVLIVDRFDRTSEGHRIGYVSAMTMLEASEGDRRSYLEIAEVVERTSARPTDELRQLWRRVVFSVLISNTDDHLRNHGFLHEGGDVWRLSPAFDLNPDPTPGRTYLTTAITEADDEADLRTALSVADYFRLSGAEARRILAQMTAALRGWRRVAARHGLTQAEVRAMEPAFAAVEQAPAETV